jgi:hypothetical protein
MAKTGMTKGELVSEIRRKAQKAKPSVRAMLTKGLGSLSKTELQRIASKMRVTKSGDINIS